MTQRQKALSWWRSIIDNRKQNYSSYYFNRNWQSLTGREIEVIYKKTFEKQLLTSQIYDTYKKWKESNSDRTSFYYAGYLYTTNDFKHLEK